MDKIQTIGIVSPSSPTKEKRILTSIDRLKSYGYNVVYNESNTTPEFDYLAASDDTRANEINQMFEDESIDIILARNGGYGTPRISDKIDYESIQKHPKVFCGFSDITLLLNTIYLKTGVKTFHGPMLTVDFSTDKQAVHISSFFKAIQNKEYVINEHQEYAIDVLKEGTNEGVLVGGNLSLLNVFIALDIKDYFANKILLIEEVHEQNYRIDRMLQTLKLKGVFQQLKGIIIGGITGAETPQKGVKKIFQDVLKDYNYPIMFNVPIGHVTPRYTVPIGGTVRMDTKSKTITVLTEGE